MTRGLVIGIDPGLSGAIACYGPDGYRSEEMPVMRTGVKNKQCVNPLGVKDILLSMGSGTVYLERVRSMPGQGVVSVFSFGDTFGCLRAVVAVLGYPIVQVTPQKWKKYYTLSSDKEQARARAIEMFPKENFNRKKDSDRAEALLIAYYGSQQ